MDDNRPSFPGVNEKFNDFVLAFVKHHFPGLPPGGEAIVNFIVNTDGSLNDPKVLKSTRKDLIGPAIDIINNSPKWNPPMQNGPSR